jgi:integrase
MRLADLVLRVATECDLEQCTIDQYNRCIRKFSEFVGHDATTEDLTLGSVNRFLVHLHTIGKTGATIASYRRGFTRVWNLAVELELVPPYDARRIRHSKIDQKPVRAWTLSQVQMLLAAAGRLKGQMHYGVLRSDFVQALVRVMYDTGLRPSDIRRMRWSDVDLESKSVSLVQHKTGRPHTAMLSPTAIALMKKIRTTDRVFPVGKSCMVYAAKQLFKMAESMGFRRNYGQGFATLRKTHATQIYEQEGEYAAAESLGHAGGVRTVRRHYIDSRSIRSGRRPPEPPAA